VSFVVKLLKRENPPQIAQINTDVGGRRIETGDRRMETGDRRRKTEDSEKILGQSIRNISNFAL
jgi:hypothetical protein